MPDLIPVANDPFVDPPSMLVPVDHDPFATPKPGMTVPPADVGQAAARLPGQIAQGAWNASGLGDVYNTIRWGGSWTDVAGAAVPLAMGVMAGPEERGVAAAEEAAAPALKGITAYHGSPYDFDKFDLSKVGTGEGAQAFGHGLYFAENPAVAEDYAKKLATQVPTAGPNIPGNPFSGASILESGPGRRYQVSIAADPEHFLDWDRPLSEQHPKVQEAMRPVVQKQLEKVDSLPWSGVEKNALRENLQNGNMTGAELYRAGFGHSDPAALRQAGVPGIRYLDQGSRGAGEWAPQRVSMSDAAGSTWRLHNPHQGWQTTDYASPAEAQAQADRLNAQGGTHNYVVFDDNLINILKKYSIGGLIAGGASHFSTTPVDHNPFQQ